MARTALDVKDKIGVMLGLTDDDLAQIPVYEGKVLEKGKVYLDLTSPEWGELRPERDIPADSTSIYVRKDQVDHSIWHALITAWLETPFAYGTNAPVQGAFAGDGGVAYGRGGEGSRSVGFAGFFVGEETKARRKQRIQAAEQWEAGKRFWRRGR